MKQALQEDSEELERQAEAEASSEKQGDGTSLENGQASSSTTDVKSSTKKPELSPEAKAAKEERERVKAEENAKQREERVTTLAEKLIRKLSVYTESVRGIGEGEEALKQEVKKSFREITRLEAEELKTER